MPFYFRKSVSAGPFRFNFSKGGVGVSVGVRGLRIGTGPRGHYVHAGRNGFYYRASIGKAGRKENASAPAPISEGRLIEPPGVDMIEIDSGDVLQMRDEKFSELLDEINAKAKQIRLATTFGWLAAITGLLVAFAVGPHGAMATLLALPAWAIGEWLDSYRRTTVLFYDITDGFEQAYQKLTSGFDQLNECSAKWHIAAGGAVQDLKTWKRNAGASHLVSKKTTTLAYGLPRVIKSNINPPSIHVGKQIIYFLPDVAFIADGSKIGAVSYDDLNIRWQHSRFIESGTVPRDAKVVDHTWQHPNKGGGPDRRFKSNREIPICLYETMHLQSNSGLNELLEFSRTGQVAAFVEGCRSLARARETAVLAPAQAVLADLRPSDAPELVEPKPKAGSLTYVVALVVVALPTIGILSNHEPSLSNKSSSQTASASNAIPTGSTASGTGYGLLQSPAGQVSEPVPAAQTSTDASTAPAAPLAPDPNQPLAVTVTPLTPPDGDAFEGLVSTISSPEPETVVSSPATPPPPAPRFGYIQLPLQLREGPSPAYLVVATVAQNVQVAIIGQENGWMRVSAGPDSIGWLPREMVGKSPISLQKPRPQSSATSITTTPHRDGGR